MMNVRSIFRLTEYIYPTKQKNPYPLMEVHVCQSSYHPSYEDAVKAMTRNTSVPNIYCFVLTELPMGIDISEDESLSETVFDADGKVISSRPFAVISDRGHEGPTTQEWIDWFESVKQFDGWEDEELKFMPGDIVEIHCRPGNRFFGNGGAQLGIIASMPPEPGSDLSDCYGVFVFGEGLHLDHAPVTAVMKPHFPVQDRFKYQLSSNLLMWGCDNGKLRL